MNTTETLIQRLDQLTEIGAALSSERDLDRLLENILAAAMAITRADGGTLYMVSDDGKRLKFAIVRNESLGVRLGGASGDPLDERFHDLPLSLPDGSPNHGIIAAYAANTGLTVNIPDAYQAEGFDFSAAREFDRATGYHSVSFLSVPMRNHENALIGVLQLINAREPQTGATMAFSAADQKFAQSLASQAAISLTNRQLMSQLENLFESFIKLINLAIDEKSPYTGHHCQRVPELTMMLAQAINETTAGPLGGLNLNDADLYELRIAALLHDCGKVTTPVHVVDKSTKLETLHDRIHLVDTRFECIKQAAQTRMWEAIASGHDAMRTRAECDAFCRQCDDDRDFLRQCNLGSERMSDEDVGRVHRIAATYRWGGPQGAEQPLIDGNELENLTIRAGTLTASERKTINHHIDATIRMLERLPWPRNLRNVPEFAGGHHERMDGKGYPRGLRREQLSWQARMIGIADIFEALTAHDRPYKKSMTLSQALAIMENFRRNGHIDPELHDVFVSQQVFRRYAEKFLTPEQIDV